ncbi:hypothetical protein D3P07_13690 [Paenibacillus sp. 1011MAR3C5]|uniref:hypothetical protein n=1 Tax=Paenibacillus sp. 1011MAR3C5 TaxID=1675787 RepID=UPI000E6B6D98|nr:hypothetical protein [Paenibacillus sp. 1011MAR3C5]RJE89000.1 hypothetical protein D3P07_13690 [Paenibacillus sp. 1011MAR3C5]
MRVFMGLMMAVIIVSGCTSQTNSNLESSIAVAEAYKKTELEADYIDNSDEVMIEQIRSKEEKLRPLTTEAFFRNKSADRIFGYTLNVAHIKKVDLELSDLAFEERENDDPSVIKLKYDGVLHLGDERMSISGRIELIDEGGTWRVKYDSYNLKDLLKIMDEDILQRNR